MNLSYFVTIVSTENGPRTTRAIKPTPLNSLLVRLLPRDRMRKRPPSHHANAGPSILVPNCGGPVPVDDPQLNVYLSLEDGYHTPVTGNYLNQFSYQVQANWPPGVSAPVSTVPIPSQSGMTPESLLLSKQWK